ncbi:hypothetical protein KCU65_g155, partial [Aureobasidium melanogenum]
MPTYNIRGWMIVRLIELGEGFKRIKNDDVHTVPVAGGSLRSYYGYYKGDLPGQCLRPRSKTYLTMFET